MASTAKLLALFATMGRINPAVFDCVNPRGDAQAVARDGLRVGELPESVVRASASRAPELTAGVAGVYLLVRQALALADGLDAAAALSAAVDDWCSTTVRQPFPWPAAAPLPAWASACRRTENWRDKDMFYSAAAAMAAVAAHGADEPTRALVLGLAERLMQRAEQRPAAPSHAPAELRRVA
jgi:hypothetical protein